MKTSPPVATAVLISSGTIAENATEYNAAAAFRINSALTVHQSFVLGARWSTTTRARTQSPSTIPCLQDPATTTRPTRLATPRRTAASPTMTQQPPQRHSNRLKASRTTTATKATMTENTTSSSPQPTYRRLGSCGARSSSDAYRLGRPGRSGISGQRSSFEPSGAPARCTTAAAAAAADKQGWER